MAGPVNPIVFAMGRPLTVKILVAAIALGSGLAVCRMPIDIFPDLNLPDIYVALPFGGNQRTVVVRVDPDRLRSYRMSPDEEVNAITAGNFISPSGTVRIGNEMPIVPINSPPGRPRIWKR